MRGLIDDEILFVREADPRGKIPQRGDFIDPQPIRRESPGVKAILGQELSEERPQKVDLAHTTSSIAECSAVGSGRFWRDGGGLDRSAGTGLVFCDESP